MKVEKLDEVFTDPKKAVIHFNTHNGHASGISEKIVFNFNGATIRPDNTHEYELLCTACAYKGLKTADKKDPLHYIDGYAAFIEFNEDYGGYCACVHDINAGSPGNIYTIPLSVKKDETTGKNVLDYAHSSDSRAKTIKRMGRYRRSLLDVADYVEKYNVDITTAYVAHSDRRYKVLMKKHGVSTLNGSKIDKKLIK